MDTETVFTGQLGLVLLLGPNTRKQAITIGSRYRNGNSINLGERHEPHVTLYHSKLQDVPRSMIREFLDDLAVRLPLKLGFTHIAPFGRKFLFWDASRSAELSGAHGYSLGLSQYFVPVGEQQADRERVEVTEEERINIRRFGHPFV